MEEFWANFHFLRPWILLLSAAPLALYGVYFKGINAQSSWQKVIDKRLLDYLLVKGSALKRKVFIWVGLIGLFAAIRTKNRSSADGCAKSGNDNSEFVNGYDRQRY